MNLRMNLGAHSYDITVERGALQKAGELLNLKRKVLIVTDKGVPEIYAQTVAKQCDAPLVVTVDGGEESKSFAVLEKLQKAMVDAGFSRKDCVVAVGGGVIGDLSGFAAAIYMRGIDFYNIPTTVLSQVDSSIGGKVAINFNNVKNIVGAFHQPKAVIIDPDTLKTLDERQIKNGLAEAVKMGATSDESLFSLFENGNPLDNIDEIIIKSLEVKKYVVEHDEKESGLRKILNFGHTVGHGIEVNTDFYHGESIALGMIPMSKGEAKERIVNVLKNLGLATEYEADRAKVLSAMMHDKKLSNGTVTVVTVEKIGEGKLCDISESELEGFVK